MSHKPSPITTRPRPDAAHKQFPRAVFAKAQGVVTGRPVRDFLAEDEKTVAIIERANAALGTTTDHAGLLRDSWRSFLISLAPYSGAARLLEIALKATLTNAEFSTNYPVRPNGPATPAWVDEGGPIPLSTSNFANMPIGPAKKQASIVAWSRELSKRSDADAIMETMLREDVAAGLDAAFFASTAASDAANAGLLNGVMAGAGYAGGDSASAKKDLIALSDAVSDGGSGMVTFVVNPKRLARLRLLDPILSGSLDIVPSAAVPVDRIIAADGPALLVSVDTSPEIDITTNALLHMSDAPLEIVSDTGPTTADPVRSLWQTATVAVRIIHELAFAKRRSTAVAYLDGATW
ncbi:phage major capsid protein [Bradyrhizobium sp.]|uniref:phage major capsid protein n=1 Tax=Bradyrhizobium sp. TaxID=376 RepID=UPI0039E5A2CF